jgi:hypothetical protein
MSEEIEEAAANLADPNLCKTDNWIAGAKWQAERMYSEEEVIAFAKWMYDYKADINKVEEWFQQFKKK